jgi:hypothetical protein
MSDTSKEEEDTENKLLTYSKEAEYEEKEKVDLRD